MSGRRIRRGRGRAAERAGRRRSRIARLAAGAGTGLGATALFAPAAQADTIVVDSLEDDGTGGTTLREAVVEANGTTEADVIVFQAGLSGTIDLVAEDIDIVNYGLEIQGPGADLITVDANGGGGSQDRVFDLYLFVDPDERVSISGLTLTGGDTSGGGGAITSRPGVDNPGELTLADVVITGNHAGNDGGGVYVEGGSLTVTNSVISNNDSEDEGGGVTVDNTDGDQETEVLISQSVISDNESLGDEGGGIYLNDSDADALIERSTISGNAANNYGGGVYVNNNVFGDVTFEGTTLSGNYSQGGGGILVDGNADAVVTLRNSTVSGNSALYSGGGVNVDGDEYDDGVDARILNSTVVGNEAGFGMGSGEQEGGGLHGHAHSFGGSYYGPELEVSSSIVANNTAPEGPDIGEDPTIDTGDHGFALGFSLVESTAGAEFTESPAGSNLFGLDPQLGPLAANGGLTQTHRPAATSPTIDAGIANGLATDQRGAPRTFDPVAIANRPGSDGTDIGSVEVQPGEGGLPGNAACRGATVPKLDGTTANDTLTGTAAPESLNGLSGNDRISGVGGADCVNGDAGRDKLKGNGGKDTVRGGAGRDNAKGNGGKDKLRGQGGKDKLNGGGGKDNLKGGAGKDKLRGGPAKDKLKGQGGRDKLNAVDGKRDKVNCGGGEDRATVDPEDRVSANCEQVVVKG